MKRSVLIFLTRYRRWVALACWLLAILLFLAQAAWNIMAERDAAQNRLQNEAEVSPPHTMKRVIPCVPDTFSAAAASASDTAVAACCGAIPAAAAACFVCTTACGAGSV